MMHTVCNALHCRPSLLIVSSSEHEPDNWNIYVKDRDSIMQDTPAAKLTYSAAITVPTPLTALMSAVPQNSPEASADGAPTHTFKFKQEVPIPSYLLALAVGELEYRQIGPRSKVS